MKWIACKIKARKNNLFGKQKNWKNALQFKLEESQLRIFTIYIYNSYKLMDLQFLFVMYKKIMEGFQSIKNIKENK